MSTKQPSSTTPTNPASTPSLSKASDLGAGEVETKAGDAFVVTSDGKLSLLNPTPDQPLTKPVMDRRQAYQITRRGVVDTSLDEGEKLHKQGCVRRGLSPTHFIFTGTNGARTRHDVHIVAEESWISTFWDAVACSCPTGRHVGDPCWHKGAVRAFLADNQRIRHASKLLGLPLI